MPVASPSPPPLAVVAPQFVFVGNLGNNTITEYQYPGGVLVRTISKGVNQPRALAVDLHGNLYSGNFGSNNITVYDPEGNLIRTITQGVNGPYALNAPGDGMIYSANYTSVTGYVIGETSPRVTITEGVSGAKNVASSAGIVYVANTTASTVTEYLTGSASLFETIATPSSPVGIASAHGSVVVSMCECGGAPGGANVYWQEGGSGQTGPPVQLSNDGTPTGPVTIVHPHLAGVLYVGVASADSTSVFTWWIGSGNAGIPLRLPGSGAISMATDAYGDLAEVDARGFVTVYAILDSAGHWTATNISNGLDNPAAIAATQAGIF